MESSYQKKIKCLYLKLNVYIYIFYMSIFLSENGPFGLTYCSSLTRSFTVKCSVQLASQCFGDIVAGKVARNIS